MPLKNLLKLSCCIHQHSENSQKIRSSFVSFGISLPRTPKCPAFNMTCSQCGIQHHFGYVCLKHGPIATLGHPQGKKFENSKVQCLCSKRQRIAKFFFSNLNNKLVQYANMQIILGGDLNCPLTPLDKAGALL